LRRNKPRRKIYSIVRAAFPATRLNAAASIHW
jgi:hypothetical protein